MDVRSRRVKINYSKTYDVIITNFYEKIFSPLNRNMKQTICRYHVCAINGKRFKLCSNNETIVQYELSKIAK